ncbi:MAG: hypothetical protein JW818_03615 [Pirellulales bacterium]|nr:hypothetical protein [Pirellulales bacterium]
MVVFNDHPTNVFDPIGIPAVPQERIQAGIAPKRRLDDKWLIDIGGSFTSQTGVLQSQSQLDRVALGKSKKKARDLFQKLHASRLPDRATENPLRHPEKIRDLLPGSGTIRV